MLAFDRLPEWSEGYKGDVKSVEYTSELRTPEDKLRVGASAHGIPKKPGESIKFIFEITESLKNEKITYRLYGMYNALVTYILEPVERARTYDNFEICLLNLLSTYNKFVLCHSSSGKTLTLALDIVEA